MRPDSAQWIAAKAHGDRAELAIAEWFRAYGWQPFKTLGRAEYDLLLQCSVEVKQDRKALETGNAAIEVAYRGKASGLVDSTAAWWAIVVGEEALLVKTETLRHYVLRDNFSEVSGGDGGSATLRLVPLDKLKRLKGLHVISLREMAQ